MWTLSEDPKVSGMGLLKRVEGVRGSGLIEWLSVPCLLPSSCLTSGLLNSSVAKPPSSSGIPRRGHGTWSWFGTVLLLLISLEAQMQAPGLGLANSK